MKWTLINPAGTNDPDTGDIYSGLDRFGRVKDNRWIDGAGTDLDRIQYGYDRAGNRIWRYNAVAASLGKEFDEIYNYDGVHRLQDMGRGTLNAERTALTSETFAQCWTLDSTGNWHGFREDSDGSGSWDLIQQRTANPVNEITNIAETTGPTWATPDYDRAGNMTTMPKVADPTVSQTCQYDAWNRLTRVSEGTDNVAAYQCDGAKRRILQKSYTGGVLSETRHLYYTEPSKWQVIEERVGTSPDSADAERQFVWGLRYIDNLILRDRDTDDDGSLDERLYACQDANWNVTTIADSLEAVQERYAYYAYGVPIFMTPTFAFRAESSFSWNTLYSGYRHELMTAVTFIRHRAYHDSLGVWLQRDPARYLDSHSLYQYCNSRPLVFMDPSGSGIVGENCAQCFGAYRRCIGRASSAYAACMAGAFGPTLGVEVTCAMLCRAKFKDPRLFTVCFGLCSIVGLSTFICGSFSCQDALDQMKLDCGNDYNRCSWQECGTEPWRPD